MVPTYWITTPGSRRPFGDYVRFLWDEQDCDTDGDAVAPQDRGWTELTITNRIDSRRVDVDPCRKNPLTLVIQSENEELAARMASALAVSTGVRLSDRIEGPAILPDALIPLLGEFDLPTALN